MLLLKAALDIGSNVKIKIIEAGLDLTSQFLLDFTSFGRYRESGGSCKPGLDFRILSSVSLLSSQGVP